MADHFNRTNKAESKGGEIVIFGDKEHLFTYDNIIQDKLQDNAIEAYEVYRSVAPKEDENKEWYVSVISSSIIIGSVDELMDDIDLGSLVGMTGLKLAGSILKSGANGAANAYITLKVGKSTIKYLEEGPQEFQENKKSVKHEIRRNARKELPRVVTSGLKNSVNMLRNID